MNVNFKHGGGIFSKQFRRIGALVLSLAMIVSGLNYGSLAVNAAAAEVTWKGEVTAAMDTLDSAMGAKDDYAAALQELAAAYNGLESAITVENFEVSAVGEDFVLLSWDAADVEDLVGYNVYWADKDLETTKFQLLGPDGDLALRMSSDLDEAGRKNPAPEMTIAAEDAGTVKVEFLVKISTFKNNYFKVAIVNDLGVGTKTDAVKSATAVEYKAILDDLGRGLTAVQKSTGVFLNWRLLWDELDGGYTETGLTGVDFNIYKDGAKIGTVTNSTNYLDTTTTSGLTADMYKIVPVKNGVEITADACDSYLVLVNDTSNTNAAYLQFDVFVPDSPGTFREYYGLSADYVSGVFAGLDTPITYSSNDATVVDVDGDGEYEMLLKWYPSNAKDVSQWGFSGNTLIDCYKLDGTLLWSVDLGKNIRSGAHNVQHLAFDFEGDGKGELILKTAPGTKTIQYEIGTVKNDREGYNVLDGNGKPVVVSEDYITLLQRDVDAGYTNQDDLVTDKDEYKEQLIEMFMDWGVWNRYSEETRETVIEPYWPTNAVELFTVDKRWDDKSFYTGGATSAALNIANMTLADIQQYVPDYTGSEKLVIVATAAPAVSIADTDRGGNQNSLLKVELVKNVVNYTHSGQGYDLSLVDKDVKDTGYTEEEAEILVGYYLNHFGYTNGRHNMNNLEGYIFEGPEYITLFDGLTGKELDTQDYAVGREDDGMIWGDYGWRAGVEPGNRVERYNATIAYLDGVTPSAIMGRGYYAKTAFEAWNVVDGKLKLVGVADSGSIPTLNPFNNGGGFVDGVDPEFGMMAGTGQHYLAPVDVDLDGRQEIFNGGSIIGYDVENEELYLYDTGGDYLGGNDSTAWKKHYHGDMMHITDVDPDNPGVEAVVAHEGGSGPWDWEVRTLTTNTVLFGVFGGADVGRITVGDILPNVRGLEIPIGSGYTASGATAALTATNSNHSLKWAADMTTQWQNGGDGADASLIGQGKTWLTATGYKLNNGTKGNPALTADIFGDAREEMIVRSTDSTKIRIYMNTEISTHKNYTPMQNIQYRAQVAGQQSAYNMPSYVDYYYAADTDWQYVTIPNRDKDQAPGTLDTLIDPITSVEPTMMNVAGMSVAAMTAAAEQDAWEALENAVTVLRIKTGMFSDDSTPFDYDVSLVNKMMAVMDAAKDVMDIPLVDTGGDTTIYSQAQEAVQNKILYTEATMERLTNAIQGYDAALENINVKPVVENLYNTLEFWLLGVDTEGIETAYSMLFDFESVQTGGSAYNNNLPYLEPGWTSIGGNASYPYLTSYDADKGYGLLYPFNGGRHRNIGVNNMLKDWVDGVVFAMELPAGDYVATVYTGELSGTAQNAWHSFYSGYTNTEGNAWSTIGADRSGLGTGTKLAGSADRIKAGAGSYVTTTYKFTLEESTQVVFEANRYTLSLIMEQYIPASVEKISIEELQAYVNELDSLNLQEDEYTAASWAVFKAVYDEAVAAIGRGSLFAQQSETILADLQAAFAALVLRGGIISYNLDFGPRVDYVAGAPGTPVLEATGQSLTDFNNRAVAGAVRDPFQLAHGDMLYADNVTENGLHWGFDQVVPDGNTAGGGAYFRDWVYSEDSGNTPYTFMADLPTGDYFVFVYTGVKESPTNTTKLIFGNEVLETGNPAATEEKDGQTVYVQQYGVGGQYAYAYSIYYVRVEENPDALSSLPRLKMGTLSITVFDDTNTSARTGVLNGLEIFPIRLDGPAIPEVEKIDVTIDGVEIESKVYDGEAIQTIGTPVVKADEIEVVEGLDLVWTYTGTSADGTGYESSAAPVNAGDYQLVISVEDNNEYYQGSSESIAFSISKAPVTVGPQMVTVSVYDVSGGDASSGDAGEGKGIPEPTLGYSGLIGDDTIEPSEVPAYTHNAGNGLTPGIYTYTWTNSDVSFLRAENYQINTVTTAPLIIYEGTVPDPGTVTVGGVSFGSHTYNGLPIVPSGTPAAMLGSTNVTPSIDGFVYTYTGTGGTVYEGSAAPVNAGTYQLIITVVDSEFVGSSAPIAFSIDRRPVAVGPKAKTISTGNPLGGFELTYEGLLGTDSLVPSVTPTFSTDAANTDTPGDFTITWTNMAAVSFSGNNNYIVNDSGKFKTALLRIVGEKIADKSALTTLVGQADAKTQSDYTAASWSVFAAALKEAKSVQSNPNATQTAVDSARIALLNAMNALVKSTGTGSTSSGSTGGTSVVDSNKFGTSSQAPDNWSIVNSDLKKNDESSQPYTKSIVTGRNILVPSTILNTLQGKNQTLAMHTGAGVTFSISSADIPGNVSEGKLNLSLRTGDIKAPAAQVKEKTAGVIASRQIPMTSTEDFGMTVNTHYSLGKDNDGKWANLYFYDETSGQLAYLGSFQINKDGQAMFGITRGADLLLTVTNDKPNEKAVSMGGGAGSYVVQSGDTLSRIASRNKVSVAQILSLNPGIMDINKIKPGQTLRLK